jgi:transposase
MARPKVPLELSPEQLAELQRVIATPSSPQKLVLRARIAVLAAEGWDNKRIASELHASHVTVGLWRQRVVDGGLAGLEEAPRPGRPRTVRTEQVQTGAQ